MKKSIILSLLLCTIAQCFAGKGDSNKKYHTRSNFNKQVRKNNDNGMQQEKLARTAKFNATKQQNISGTPKQAIDFETTTILCLIARATLKQ